ncbi:phosphoglycerate dehydrogenase [Psychromonas aquimarina]|uniref:phosphoglycerate dehydrogenase n=1 Tax=Psychromonas aquimarina TaxID=444919 RepID=UPI0003F4B8B3|nr:phosphoglycerate dehydrogenase [Psychromonas aquimarina]
MFQIRTYNQIASIGLDNFSRDNYEVASTLSLPDALVLRSFKLHDEPLADSVKAVARAGAGVNNIPVEKCSEKGIVVFNTPGANANAVKELVLLAMLLCSRGAVEGINHCRGLTDISDAEIGGVLEQAKKQFKGSEIAAKTLGVVGLGAIGANVANMGIDLGMNVVGYDPAISIDAAWRLSSKIEKMENLHSLLARCDYVTLHIPAMEATKNLINSEALAHIKEGACLLNFARGEVCDAQAVTAALDSGRLLHFATDFPTAAMIHRSEVIPMPHLGASTEEAEDNCAIMACNQLIEFLENGNIKNSVNFPPISLERNTPYRITFVNENVAGVLGNVLSILADENVNVTDMMNKSRDNIGYNIIDLESEPQEELIEAIRKVEHVIAVRSL